MRSAFTAVLALAVSIFASPAQESIVLGKLPKSVEFSSEGPWGNLDFYEIKLSSPPRYLSQIAIPSAQEEWQFTQESREEIVAALQELEFTDTEINYLIPEGAISPVEEALKIFPKASLISGIPSSLRSRFYPFLGLNPANRFHHRPAYLNTTNVTRYFHQSKLPLETLQNIAKLAYPTPSGHGYFLSDLPYLLTRAESREEETLLLNALNRVPALMVRLNLSDTDDMEEVADYWSSGFKNKQVLPLFESVQKNHAVSRLDIGHLLPPTARRNLNRFPEQSDGVGGRYPDWFWSCYNFFRFAPKDVYAETKEYEELMASSFFPAPAPYTFGDMLLLNSKGRVIHGCIYIADDIVYTKNGPGILSPFILMRLKDVVAYHDLVGDVTLSQFRKTARKGEPETLDALAPKSN